jgi:hypothetical protein
VQGHAIADNGFCDFLPGIEGRFSYGLVGFGNSDFQGALAAVPFVLCHNSGFTVGHENSGLPEPFLIQLVLINFQILHVVKIFHLLSP